MKFLNLSFQRPEEQLACDEAMLYWAENHDSEELLRFWEASIPFVVLGCGNVAAREADLPACRARQVPVLRRCSGGGAVLQGPGCLNFSLALRIAPETGLWNVGETHRRVLERHGAVIESLLDRHVRLVGTSDLALGNLKFSGNAQRRRARVVLYHGTFLLKTDFTLMESLLPLPSLRPEYRGDRKHSDFLTNLPLESHVIQHAIRRAWNASDVLEDFPLEPIRHLMYSKYSRPEWHLRR